VSRSWTFRVEAVPPGTKSLTTKAFPLHIRPTRKIKDPKMRTQSAEAVVRLMVDRDPRQAAETILLFLMGVNGAAAGAIFFATDDLRLFVGHRIGQEALDWAGQRWSADRSPLLQGRLSRSGDQFLVPILRAERLAAVVFLAASQLDLGSIEEVSGLIAEAVVRAARQPHGASAVDAYLERTPAKEIERRKLVILLDQHEWNLARVARELRVTRTTLYKRLTSFGIPRKHVAKQRRETDPIATTWKPV
jgi:hypothetical protein